MFYIKSLLISLFTEALVFFYTVAHFYKFHQFWAIRGLLNNPLVSNQSGRDNIINFASQFNLYNLFMTLALVAMVQTLLIFIVAVLVFFDINFLVLDYNIFQVIHCDDINGDQIVNAANRTSSTIGISNDGPSFVANSSSSSIVTANDGPSFVANSSSPDNGDNSWAMTTIRPYSPNAIENFSDVETIPDGVNTDSNWISRRIWGAVILTVGGCVVVGVIVVFSVLGSKHVHII